MEYLAWYWIITVLFFITTVALFIILLDMKNDKDSYKMGYEIIVSENQDLQRKLVDMENERDKAQNELMATSQIDTDNLPHFGGLIFCETEKEKLEAKLAEINYKEKYPLCAHILNNPSAFFEFYVNGKCIGKWHKQGAIEYAKKNFKQIDWTNINAITEIVGAYDVVKKPSKK
jgi:hypothetical protein